jgi:hypothetical protein
MRPELGAKLLQQLHARQRLRHEQRGLHMRLHGAGAAGPSSSSRATLTTPTTSSSEPRHTGYQECAPAAPGLLQALGDGQAGVQPLMSERGSIIDVSGRSSR